VKRGMMASFYDKTLMTDEFVRSRFEYRLRADDGIYEDGGFVEVVSRAFLREQTISELFLKKGVLTARYSSME